VGYYLGLIELFLFFGGAFALLGFAFVSQRREERKLRERKRAAEAE
jgi:hypothetical protein